MAVADIATLSEEALVAEATKLVPVLRERAEAANRARSAPVETIEDFRKADLFGVLKPKRFGGKEMRFDDFLRIANALGPGDGSAAWVYTVITVHELLVSYFPEEVQAEIWDDPRTLVASSFIPGGKPEPAKGGVRISGKWSFSSGVDHCQWVYLGAFFGMVGDPPHPDVRYMMLPMSDCKIVDDWYVAGLQGTGSKSVAVDNAFVPDNRIVAASDFEGGTTPGAKFLDGPLYKAPFLAVFPFCLSAPATGIARGALEQFIGHIKARESSVGGKISDMKHVQMRVAEASALIDAASLMYWNAVQNAFGKIYGGQELTLEERVRHRRDQCYSSLMAARAVELLIKSTGGQGLYDSNPVQRAHRDLQAKTAHLAVNWDFPAVSYGNVLMGGGPTDFLF